jgi:hypothetical protein
MSRELRSIVLTCLVIIFYALSGLLQTGKFIFPFPIYDFIFLLLVLIFTFQNWNKYTKINFLFYFLLALFQILSNEFYWSLFLNTEEMTKFSYTLTTDVFYLLVYFTFLIEITRYFILQKWKKFMWTYPLIFFVLISSLLLNIEVLRSLGIFIFASLLLVQQNNKNEKSQYFYPAAYLLFLMIFFDFTKFITLFLI